MSKTIVESVSFKKEYLAEHEYAKQQEPNFSVYICNLIRKDMNKEDIIDAKVKEKIYDMIMSGEITVKSR